MPAMSSKDTDNSSCFAELERAVETQQLTESAAAHIRTWLQEPRYASYRDQVVEHISKGDWKTLDDVFWTIIPFGTGGRRGRMYPIGCNAINDRTIGESAQGLANYINGLGSDEAKSCAIAYDTRINSRHFAEWCAGIMVANGFKVYFLDDYRSTPELSFLVRYKQCTAGIMVTASHNPPSDNAVKVYWSTGGQLVPPHDQQVIEQVQQVDQILCAPFEKAVSEGNIEICTSEVDEALLREHVKQSLTQERNVKIIYSPLHGVGEKNVCDLLHAVGFEQVEVFGPHRERDGNFPNVPGHVSNPENPAVFDTMIERARAIGADLILATDPDCDRLGVAAPLTTDLTGPWGTLSGNQIGALLTDYVLQQRQALGTLTSDHYVVKTLVTTELTARIAESYGVGIRGNLHVGFKWIGLEMDQSGPDLFVFGTEESHGYLVGQYARDKDGAVACLLMSELAAVVKKQGLSLHQHLDQLSIKHGYHAEQLINIQMTGSDGMRRMQALLDSIRQTTPTEIGGIGVAALRDYKSLQIQKADGTSIPLDAPAANMLILDLEEPGNYIAVRPSGTEPKVKLYMFACTKVDDLESLAQAKLAMSDRLQEFGASLQSLADSIQ
jgi:phosphomannomutase